ncbi:MAG TPA: SCO family protein [Caulobacteraceae bacterium]|jgi:protein SCO1/2
MPARIVQIVSGSEPRRRTRGAIFALALAACGTLSACGPAPQAAAGASGAAQASNGPGGPFQLVNQDGKAVDQSVLNGKWSIVFFGYTFCPDFCPTTLTNLGQAMQILGPTAAKTQVVFVSVDPARDTPAELKTYLSAKVFPKNIMGLTGTPAQVAQAAKDYMVYYQKDGSGPNYTVDHSTALYVMDPKGQYKGVIAEGLTPAQQAQQIQADISGA